MGVYIEKYQLPAAVVISAFAVGLVVHWLMSQIGLSDVQRRLAFLDKDDTRKNKLPFIRMLGPFRNMLLAQTAVFIPKDKWLKIKRKIVKAGLSDMMSPDEFILNKIIMSIICGAVLPFLLYLSGIELSKPVIFFLLIGGFLYPDLVLWQATAKRQREIRANLPYAIDLLALSVEAGLDFISAITRMVKKTKKNALMEEFSKMEREIRLGATRTEALRNMAERCDMADVTSFTSLLIQSEKLGVSIGQILRQQSEEMRLKRFSRAEAEGSKASQKLLFPMVMFIFPAVFLAILGPLIVKWMTGGFGIGM